MRLLACVLAFMISAGSAWATPDTTHRWDLGATAGVAVYDDDTFEEALNITGRATYGFNEKVAIGLEVGHNVDSDATVAGFDLGGISATSVMVDLILRFPNSSQVLPYAFVGVGGYFWEFDKSIALQNLNQDIEVDDSLAFQVGVGVDWYLNEHWAAVVEAAYVFTEANSELVNTTTGINISNGEDDLDHWRISGGFKYLI